jgi:hypothetical protein
VTRSVQVSDLGHFVNRSSQTTRHPENCVTLFPRFLDRIGYHFHRIERSLYKSREAISATPTFTLAFKTVLAIDSKNSFAEPIASSGSDFVAIWSLVNCWSMCDVSTVAAPPVPTAPTSINSDTASPISCQ